ncbi:MAG: energy-coupling factor transporter transmembrane protein EcfT [Chloroflexota bacterium]|nr:energy-coupling factor transporter transmembrane protein EcfT [Chloroflexota bacterium]
MSVFGHYEADSWLGRRNPTAKLGAHLIISLLLTVVFDPLTPLAFLGATIAVGKALGGIGVGMQLRALLPIWLLSLSLVVSNALFASDSAAAWILWSWGPFVATVEGALLGLSLAERGVAIAALTLLLVSTTDPEDLVRSLMQNAHLPARITYPTLAAYRTLPLLAEDWETIRLAHRLRSHGARGGPIERIRANGAQAVALLATAIRRAERTALAMDSRGFGGGGQRTHYLLVPFGAADIWLLVTAFTGGAGILAISAWLGLLELWSGRFGA